MKLSKDFKYTVLCEDAQSRTFIVSFLKCFGIVSGRIRVINYPAGRGCGSAYVRDNYPNEVRILRATNYNRTVLIVCMDADDQTVTKRKEILEDAVSRVLSGWNRINEPIIMWIPKREIETWIHFLNGEEVDEEKEYRHDGKPVSCKKEAYQFAQYCQGISDFEKGIIPSLAEAKDEYLRVCELQERWGMR